MEYFDLSKEDVSIYRNYANLNIKMRYLTVLIFMRFFLFLFLFKSLPIDTTSLMSRKLGTSVNDVFNWLFYLAVRLLDLRIHFC